MIMPTDSILHPERNGRCEICGADLTRQPAQVMEQPGVYGINIWRCGIPGIAMFTGYHCHKCKHNTLYTDAGGLSILGEILEEIFYLLKRRYDQNMAHRRTRR
jgi:hypothetical protein